MSRSERVYRAMLRAYPEEHRRLYAEPMEQLFRDRLRRDGGGFGTVRVWIDAALDLAGAAFIERLETAMNVQTWTSRWWEAVVLLYAVTQFLAGVSIDSPAWAIGFGFVPAALLVGGLVLRNRARAVATVLIIVGSLLPAVAFWTIYPFVVGSIIIAGGLWSGKIGGSRATEPSSA